MRICIRLKLSCLVLLLLSGVLYAQGAPGGPRFLYVEAEGQGATKEEAFSQACVEAVRKAVGSYLVSNTSLATNNLSEDFQEQIIFHSRGLITSYIPLYTINKNYIWTVGIKAEIENNVMQETVTGIIQNATKPRNSAVIDAASKWAEQKAYEQSQQEAQKQTQEMFKRSAVDLTNLFVKEFDMSNMLTVISHQEVFDSST